MNTRIAAAATALFATLSVAALSMAAAQQPYPARPIRFIIPFPPGGSSDPMARLIGQKLTESWGQPVIADNRPGGNTIIATEAAAKAAPDGYTLLMTPTGTFVTTPLLMATPYDVMRDFAPVAAFASSEWLLVVHPALPVSDLKTFIALAKSRPGEISSIVALPDYRERISAQGLDPTTATPQQFAEIIKADTAKFGRVIKAANIRMEK